LIPLNKEEQFSAGLGLKTKFLIWLVIFILTVMVIVYFYFTYHETAILSREIKLRGEAICNNLVASAEDFLVMKDDLGLAKLVYDTKDKNEGIIYCFIVDEKKMVWAHTDVSQVNKIYTLPPDIRELNNKQILAQPYKMADGTEVFAIAMPIKVRGAKIGEAHVAVSQNSIKQAVAETRKGIALVAVVIMLIGIIGILVLVSVIIGSLGEVTEDIAAIGDGDLDRKIVTTRGDEIGRIAHAVKIMTKKLKRARQVLIERERMKREMQIAKEIQQTLLPRSLPQFHGFMIDAYYQSAMEVGGDYYDILQIDENHFGIVIGDVSGKGVAGSLIMAMVRSIMKIEAPKNPSPHRLLTVLDTTLRDDIPEGMFITLFYVVFDLKEYEITYCCAGHNPAYYIDSQRKLITLKPEGTPLGISALQKADFVSLLQEEKKKFNPGEILVLYTDGVTEAMNNRKEQFGEARFEKLLKERAASSTPGLFKRILINEIEIFTGKEPQSDDITLLIIKREQQE